MCPGFHDNPDVIRNIRVSPVYGMGTSPLSSFFKSSSGNCIHALKHHYHVAVHYYLWAVSDVNAVLTRPSPYIHRIMCKSIIKYTSIVYTDIYSTALHPIEGLKFVSSSVCLDLPAHYRLMWSASHLAATCICPQKPGTSFYTWMMTEAPRPNSSHQRGTKPH